MRKPAAPGSPAEDEVPEGGHARDRARQFQQQRGVPPAPAEGGSGLPSAPPAQSPPGPPPAAPKKR